MNKVILLGRLVSDPEVRYSQGAQPVAVARYTLAVNRRFKRQGDPEADFIKIIAFGKGGEFAEKYLKKGQQISVVGRIQVRSWDDNEGKKRWSTEVVAEEQYFADSPGTASSGSKSQSAEQTSGKENNAPAAPPAAPEGGFYPVDESVSDDDLPF